MFRRKPKSDISLPEPPTREEILEDLEYFSMDRMFLGKERRGSSVSVANVSITKDSPSGDDDERKRLDDWWQTFEGFLDNIDDLESYRQKLDLKRSAINALDEEICAVSGDISARLKESVQKAAEEIAENGNDLR